ncbi:MAG TPA: hypothetical protein VEX60_17570 [Pyrinomonadaceae bacterium]|nr:hypothetical protein [Pyrinomonadaceae bacterium]
MTERYNQQDGEPDSGEVASDPGGERAATLGERATEPNVAGQGLGQISGADGERPTSRTPGDTDSVEAAGETVAADTVSGPADTRPVGSGTLARVDDASEGDAGGGKKGGKK